MRTKAVTISVAAATLVAASTMAASAAGSDDLVGLWEFGDGEGAAIADTSGNGNHGEELFPMDRTPHWGAGAFAGSLLLSATTNNHVQVPASPSLNRVRTGITVVATVNPQDLWKPGDKGSGFTAIVQRQWREEGHPDQFYLGYGQVKGILYYKWHVGLTGDAEANIYALPPGAERPVANAWVQVAGTYDASNGGAVLYVNGVALKSVYTSGEIRLDAESEQRPMAIGAEINGANIRDTVGEFSGYLDEVRLYDRALTATEVAEIAGSTARLRWRQ